MKRKIMFTAFLLVFGLTVTKGVEAAAKDVKFTEVPYGACPKKMTVEVKDGKIAHFSAERGCNGNLRALGILLEGKKVEDVVALLDDNHCTGAVLTGYTSCMDNLAEMLKYHSLGMGNGHAEAIRENQKSGNKVTEKKLETKKTASLGHICVGCGFCSASQKNG
ncbi:MAG: TSCPD domain-containing protein [Fusobacteriaceae bacterium]